MLDNADTFYLVSGGQAGGGTRERNVYDYSRPRCTFRPGELIALLRAHARGVRYIGFCGGLGGELARARV